jgi:UDPglucose 6-dehydrogenase
MEVTVVGTGYVGLVTGTCFADAGHRVICVDNNPKKLQSLRAGQLPIYEPGLKPLFERSVKEGRLLFTDDLKSAVDASEFIFLCLPTPPGADGQADLKFILQVAAELGSIITSPKIIVNKSTVPVGTAEKVKETIARHTDVEFSVVSNPEFLREGVAVEDFMRPERVVVGTSNPYAAERMKKLYEPFVRSGNPILIMDERSSELTKYAANAFLATKITFMNEMANLCEKVGANVDMVRYGIGSDSRIGKRFLFPGIGYGGSCFPKDVQALDYASDANGYRFEILKSVMAVNDAQKMILVDKIRKYYKNEIQGKHFGVWGLSFKPETDDVREAPSLYILSALLDLGAIITAYDPEAIETFKNAFGDDKASRITFVTDSNLVFNNTEALIICTEWNEFRGVSPEVFQNSMENPVIFDGRNLYDPQTMKNHSITYISIGREEVGFEVAVEQG